MAALALDGWWDEPHYKQSYTPNERGEFILGKLMQHDPKTFGETMREMGQTKDYLPMAETMTSAQWRTILGAMGANLVEIGQVLTRMGLE